MIMLAQHPDPKWTHHGATLNLSSQARRGDTDAPTAANPLLHPCPQPGAPMLRSAVAGMSESGVYSARMANGSER